MLAFSQGTGMDFCPYSSPLVSYAVLPPNNASMAVFTCEVSYTQNTAGLVVDQATVPWARITVERILNHL